MTQPVPQQFPTQQFPPAPPAAPKRSNFWVGRWAFGIYGLLLGVLLGGSMFAGAGATTASPAPSTTVTVTAPPPDVTEGASEPTDEPTAEQPAGYTPHTSDWKVGVKVTKKQCFGEAGCNVTVTINPQYVGTEPLPDSGTIEVTYAISGDESGPTIGTFSVEGGSASYDKETDLSTKSSHTKIAAKVTDVDYSE